MQKAIKPGEIGYFDSSRLLEYRFPNGTFPSRREDPKSCHRGFIILGRLEAARHLRDRISIERFAVPSGGGRDECRRMCRPQGRRNLIHCPPYLPSLSLAPA